MVTFNNLVNRLLKVTSVQNTVDIIGHQDIRSTISYKHYALSKKKLKNCSKKFMKMNNKII